MHFSNSLLLTSSLFLSTLLSAQNEAPVVSNVIAAKTVSGYTINYSLFDVENDASEVFIRASLDGGKSYTTKATSTSGDVGPGISTGSGKSITWVSNPLLETPGQTIIFKVIADDGINPTVQEIVDQFDFNLIYQNFLGIYGNNSPANPAHYQQSREYIRDYYVNQGLQTELDTFFSNIPDTILPAREGINVYATIQGMDQSDSTILMTGHYDTVEDTPGADDNNMSVAMCMEAARVLKGYTFRNNLKFAQWDLEEIGLLGAYYYAMSAKSADTKAVINFDGVSIYKEEANSQMVPTGFDVLFPAAYEKAEADSFRGNFITLITDAKSSNLGTRAVELAPQVTPTLKFIDISCPDPSCLIATDLRRSDHAPFWDRAVPAIFLTATTEFRSSCYHQPCDTVINLDFSTKVIQLASALMADKAGIMHAGFSLSQPLGTGVKEINLKSNVVQQPFPNPVDHSCFFNFTLTDKSEISLNIVDLSGRKIDEVKATLAAGEQTLAWTPSRTLAHGNYVAQVLINGQLYKSFQLTVNIDPDRLNHGH